MKINSNITYVKATFPKRQLVILSFMNFEIDSNVYENYSPKINEVNIEWVKYWNLAIIKFFYFCKQYSGK